MFPSRKLLLLGWGLLTLGLVFQVARPDDSADISADELALVSDDDATEGHGSRSTGSLRRTDGPTYERTGEPKELIDGPSPTDGEDEPPAEPVLPTEASVATVTGNGVAAMAEPALGAVQHWFPSPTQFGGDRAFLVIDQTSSDEWVKVSLPVKPNGQEGWIPRADVEITSVRHRALVDLSDDSVTVWAGDDIIVDTKAVTGKPSTPTPFGVFYVRDIIAQPDTGGDYGPYILALSGFSEVLDTFDGGLPALAIHGTNRPEQIGSERSSGCVRIPNELITLLADLVPLGTPVTVVA